jgi:hypothetical protein
MKVRLSAEVVSDADSLALLDDILRFFEVGRHEWVIDDIECIERSGWVTQAGERHRARILELLRKTATDAAYGEGTPFIEIEIGTGDGHVLPSTAWDVMNHPAHLVVENATSDGRFLRALIHAYGHPLLETALRERWLMLDQAGGAGEIPKRIGTLLREQSSDRRRIQALVDSDRLHPEDESDTVLAMRALEQEHAVVVHVLHKRDTENYLPLDAIAHVKYEHRRFRTVYEAFCQLSPEQQDHFDMKSGFDSSTKGDVALLPAQASLFAGLRQTVLRALAGGFGRSCGCWFETSDGRVPHYITRATLEARCSTKPGELAAILAKIEAML